MSKIGIFYSCTYLCLFGCIVKLGMFTVRVWNSVEFWTLFYRYKPRWSSAPKNNIYKCIFVWRQLLSVYNGRIRHRRQGGHAGEQEQKN